MFNVLNCSLKELTKRVLSVLAIRSLRSKRFRAVLEQRMRNESQGPSKKWGFHSIFHAAKTENPFPRHSLSFLGLSLL